MNRGDYYGRETILLANEFFQLECLADGGPRIVRLVPEWLGENILAEVPEAVTHTPHGDFHFMGGHRLWVSPESLEITYIPDDFGVTAKRIANGVKLEGGIQPDAHLRKSITVQVSPDSPFVMLKHTIENLGRTSMRLSPWALTMLRTESTAILPQELGTVDRDGVLPNRTFSLWAYSRWDDPRLTLDDEFIKLKATSEIARPFKLGYFNPHGWLGCVFEDVFFLKRFSVRREETYPDNNCNAEVYTNDRFIELESLGPLVELQPQEEVVLTETWEVYELDLVPPDLFGGKTLKQVLK